MASSRTAAPLIALLLMPAAAVAQTNPAAQAARKWRQQHERAIVDEFVTLLSVPNVSSDKPNIQRNAELIQKMLAARGVASVSANRGRQRPSTSSATPNSAGSSSSLGYLSSAARASSRAWSVADSGILLCSW